MPYKAIFTCAGCGKEKGEVNHWWVAFPNPLGVFVVKPWTKERGQDPEYDSYCGQACVTKALSEWMDRQAKAAAATTTS